jgi:hypothetical protein
MILAALRSGAVLDAAAAIEAASSQPSGVRGPPPAPAEPDAHRVMKRQVQVAMGKNTLGYEVYRLRLPLEARTMSDPVTPDASRVHSQRGWMGAVRRWRRMLHREDPSGRAEGGCGGGGEGEGEEGEGEGGGGGGADESVVTLPDGRRRARALDAAGGGRGALLLRLAYGDAARDGVGRVAAGRFKGGGEGEEEEEEEEEEEGGGGGARAAGGGRKLARRQDDAPPPRAPARPPVDPLLVVHPSWRAVRHGSEASFVADPFALAPGPGSRAPPPRAPVPAAAAAAPLDGCAAGCTHWDELAGGAGEALRARWESALRVVPAAQRHSGGAGVDCALAAWARRELVPTLPPQTW